MKHLKRIVNGGFVGIGIGFTVNLIFSALHGSYEPGVPSFLEQFDSKSTGVFIETLIYMTLGIIQSYASDIMDNKKRSLLSNTIIHFFVVLIPLLIAAHILHWSQDIIGLLFIGMSIGIVYTIIWLLFYFSIKSELKKINQAIELRNKSK